MSVVVKGREAGTGNRGTEKYAVGVEAERGSGDQEAAVLAAGGAVKGGGAVNEANAARKVRIAAHRRMYPLLSSRDILAHQHFIQSQLKWHMQGLCAYFHSRVSD